MTSDSALPFYARFVLFNFSRHEETTEKLSIELSKFQIVPFNTNKFWNEINQNGGWI